MGMMEYVWLGVTVLAGIVEAAVPSLVSIWFVPGGIAALIVSMLGGPVWAQVLMFLGVSCAALLLTRPLARKFQNRKAVYTNADRVLGKTAVVTEDVDNVMGTGRVTVLGNSWSARSAEADGKIPRKTMVQVERIDGVKLIVAPLHTERSEEV